MAMHMQLGALKLEDIFDYAKKYLDISFEICEYLYAISDGETKLIQQILHHIVYICSMKRRE